MVAGYFGVAAAAKSRAPTAPLWALMLASQVIDVLYVALIALHIEGSAHFDANHFEMLDAPYSHSALVALLIAVVAGLLARRWGPRAAGAVAGVVVAHWLLDLVLLTGLTVLPGNAADLPLLGFGLGSNAAVSLVLDVVLTLAGAGLYWRSATSLPAPSIRASAAYRTQALITGTVTAGLLVLALVADLFGLG